MMAANTNFIRVGSGGVRPIRLATLGRVLIRMYAIPATGTGVKK